jgi:hypothetical protein
LHASVRLRENWNCEFLARSKHKVHFDLFQFNEGKFNQEMFLNVASMIVENDAEMMKSAKHVAEKCGTTEGSRCEQAFEFTKFAELAIQSEHVDVRVV